MNKAFHCADALDYHLYKAAQDYETLKSGLGEYVKKVEQQRRSICSS